MRFVNAIVAPLLLTVVHNRIVGNNGSIEALFMSIDCSELTYCIWYDLTFYSPSSIIR